MTIVFVVVSRKELESRWHVFSLVSAALVRMGTLIAALEGGFVPIHRALARVVPVLLRAGACQVGRRCAFR